MKVRSAFLSEIKSALDRLGLAKRNLISPILLGVAATILNLIVLGLFIPVVQILLSSGKPDSLGKFSFILEKYLGENPFWFLLTILIVIVVIQGICSYYSKKVINRLVLKSKEKLQSSLLKRYMEFGAQYLDSEKTGASLKKIEKIPQKATKVIVELYKLLVNVNSIIFYFIAMLILSWPLAVVSSVFFLVYYFSLRRFTKKIEQHTENLDKIEDTISINLHELINNMFLVRSANMQHAELNRWKENAQEKYNLERKILALDELIIPIKDILGIILLLLFAWLASALASTFDSLAVSRIVIFFLILRRSINLFSIALKFPDQWSVGYNNIQKANKILAKDDELMSPAGEQKVPRLTEGLRVKSLTFSYDHSFTALDSISCFFEKGKLNILCGVSGSGKSTLAQLILQTYQSPSGSLWYDDIDILDFEMKDFNRKIAYVGSKPMFFDNSIRYNVTYGLDNISDECIWEVARLCETEALLKRVDGGLDAMMGERGNRFSEGEKQRIALMRVFLQHPELIILDEATSALDAITQTKIMHHLRQVFLDKTLIVITHNLNLIQLDDRVIMLENGKVRDEGYCRDLIKKEGPFSTFWKSGGQFI